MKPGVVAVSVAFGVLTSDPNLLPCELERLNSEVPLGAGPRAAAGLGWYAHDSLLLRRCEPGEGPRDLKALASPPFASEALLYHATTLPTGASLDESTQPFRSRRWLFAQTGSVEAFPEVKRALLDELPDFLRRAIVGSTQGEHAFVAFRSVLRAAGRTDDRGLDGETAAGLLGQTMKHLQELSSRVGAARVSSFALWATNQRLLLAARSGEAPLFYQLLEGSDQCARCGLPSAAPKSEALMRAHRRRKTLVVATHVVPSARWLELPRGHALAMDWPNGLKTFAI